MPYNDGIKLADELKGRTFRFGRVDGTTIGELTLMPNGAISGYKNRNESSWSVKDGKLLFHDTEHSVTTIFNEVRQDGSAYVLYGDYVLQGEGPWHILTEIARAPHESVITQLMSELYGDDGLFVMLMQVIRTTVIHIRI